MSFHLRMASGASISSIKVKNLWLSAVASEHMLYDWTTHTAYSCAKEPTISQSNDKDVWDTAIDSEWKLSGL